MHGNRARPVLRGRRRSNAPPLPGLVARRRAAPAVPQAAAPKVPDATEHTLTRHADHEASRGRRQASRRSGHDDGPRHPSQRQPAPTNRRQRVILDERIGTAASLPGMDISGIPGDLRGLRGQVSDTSLPHGFAVKRPSPRSGSSARRRSSNCVIAGTRPGRKDRSPTGPTSSPAGHPRRGVRCELGGRPGCGPHERRDSWDGLALETSRCRVHDGSVTGTVMNPVRIHPPPTHPAQQQPRQQVAAHAAVPGRPGRTNRLDGDEVLLTDNAGCATLFEITHSCIGFHRCTGRPCPTPARRASWSTPCRFHT